MRGGRRIMGLVAAAALVAAGCGVSPDHSATLAAPGMADDSPRAKRSKMWWRSCSGTPGPRSSTAKRTTVSLPDTIRAVGPPA